MSCGLAIHLDKPDFTSRDGQEEDGPDAACLHGNPAVGLGVPHHRVSRRGVGLAARLPRGLHAELVPIRLRSPVMELIFRPFAGI